MCLRTPLHVDPVAALRKHMSRTRFSGAIRLRCWSITTGVSVFASVTVPPSGASSPVRILSKVVLPAPFAPTRRNAVLAGDTQGEVVHDHTLAPPEAFGDFVRDDHGFALRVVAGERELGRALGAQHRGALRAHFPELFKAAHVALAPRGDPAFEPVRFDLELGIELVSSACLFGIDRFIHAS